jgi:hypothetical protein
LNFTDNPYIDIDLNQPQLSDGLYHVETVIYWDQQPFAVTSPSKLEISNSFIDYDSLINAVNPLVRLDPHHCYIEAIKQVGTDRLEVTLGS